MRQVKYLSSSFDLRLEYPANWDVESISSVTLRITDLAGTELLAASAATLWTTDTIVLDGAVSAFANQITLKESLGGSVPALETGDRLRIGMSGAGQWEEVEVVAWNSVTKIATLDRDLRWAHSDEASITALWATYTLDASDTDVFPLNKQMVLRWAADTDDLEITERAEIAKFGFAYPGFEEAFATLYPYEYEVASQPEGRLPALLDAAHTRVRHECLLRGLEFNRVVNNEVLLPVISAKVRWLILLNGDDRYNAAEERELAQSEYNRLFELLASSVIWEDTNQDEIQQEEEVTSHEWMGIERGL